MGRQSAIERVQRAAIRKFAEIDLSPLAAFLVKDFGAKQLAHWANRKFGADLDESIFVGATTPAEAADKLVAKAHELYRRREIAYPVDFAIESTNAGMQQDPAGALAQFCAFVKARYGLEWDAQSLPSNDPTELRRMLVERAESIGDAEVSKRTQECLARGRDADSIARWFGEECLVRLSESERDDAAADPERFVRTKVADLVRLELTQFERWILLSILDNAWKDNLHAMDQIRDSIGFRAFSQKDPRIEFKRESAKTFSEMQETIRDRVTDIAFRGRLAPQAPRAMPRPQVSAAAAPAALPADAAGGGGAAAGVLAPAAAPVSAAPVAAPALASESPVDPSTLPVVGRNEPCPCGSGLKYRQCHGKKPDAAA